MLECSGKLCMREATATPVGVLQHRQTNFVNVHLNKDKGMDIDIVLWKLINNQGPATALSSLATFSIESLGPSTALKSLPRVSVF